MTRWPDHSGIFPSNFPLYDWEALTGGGRFQVWTSANNRVEVTARMALLLSRVIEFMDRGTQECFGGKYKTILAERPPPCTELFLMR